MFIFNYVTVTVAQDEMLYLVYTTYKYIYVLPPYHHPRHPCAPLMNADRKRRREKKRDEKERIKNNTS